LKLNQQGKESMSKKYAPEFREEVHQATVAVRLWRGLPH
jgi:hypothetical protein